MAVMPAVVTMAWTDVETNGWSVAIVAAMVPMVPILAIVNLLRAINLAGRV